MVYRHRDYKPSDDIRETPPDFFDKLNAKHNFTIDACALPSNTKCELFYAPDGLYIGGRASPRPLTLMRAGVNGLTGRFDKQRVFANPPFSGFDEWLPWAWEHSEAESITMIAPATRTDRPWWQTWVEPYRDDQPERRNGPVAPGKEPRGWGGWRLKTDYTPGRIDFLEDGHPVWQRTKQGEIVRYDRTGSKHKAGDPRESTAMFGLVVLEWSHV